MGNGQFECGLAGEELAVVPHSVRLGVDLHGGQVAVQAHVLFAACAGPDCATKRTPRAWQTL